MSEERFGRIDKTPEDVRERFDGIDRRFDAIDGRLDGIDHRLDDLGRHIRVLHEEVIDRIQSIADPTHTIRRDASLRSASP